MNITCKVCLNSFLDPHFLTLKNMPKGAQYLPSKQNLENDRGVHLKIAQCKGCGLVQLLNEPVPYFKEVIRSTSFSKEMTKFRKKQFEEFIDKYHLNDKKIVEIGSGTGDYLSIMNQLNINAYGVEFSQKSVNACRDKGLSVEKGFINSTQDRLSNGPFDAFFMMSFLEHIPYPNDVLKAIVCNLKDDAIGIVEVPNFQLMIDKKLFSEFISDHIFYFTMETIKQTLRINGFNILESSIIWNDYIISIIVEKRRNINFKRIIEDKERITSRFKQFIGQFPKKTIAVWGAGHQSIALISLLNLGDHIKYVVDSATFKQNKYMPVSHIPIKPPEILNNDPVRAVIVVAGSYGEEVIYQIKENYRLNIKVAVFNDNELKISDLTSDDDLA